LASSVRVADNRDAVAKTLDLLERTQHGVIFINLNDSDSKFGHRRDVRGYGNALEALDANLPSIFERLRTGDQLMFTADHGCDPTAAGSDHTREFVPYIHVGGRKLGDLAIIEGLDAVGTAMADAFFDERKRVKSA